MPLVRGTARAPIAAPPPDWPSLAPSGASSPTAVTSPAPATAPTPHAGSEPGFAAGLEEERETAAMLTVHLSDEEREALGVRSDPPPLPRRTSQTHLAPQLQSGPPARADEDEGAHDPALMASFMRGVSRGEAGAPAGTESR